MKLYAVCPICGHKLLKGDDGTNVEVLCPKCSHKIICYCRKPASEGYPKGSL